jgi:O-antigen/teichoic acid export membrane protein
MMTQGIASVATVVLSVLVARSVPEVEFGIFAVTISTWIILVGSIRAATAELFVFNYTNDGARSFVEMNSKAMSAGVLLSVGCSLLLSLVGLFIPTLTEPFFILAMGLPALFLQDSNRYVLVAQKRHAMALLVDTAYVVSLVLVMAVFTSPDSLSILLTEWVGSSWLAAVVGVALIRPHWGLKAAISWFRGQGPSIRYFVGDFLVANGVANAAVYFVAIWGTLSDSAAIRGSQVLLVPILLIMRGASVALGSELANMAKSRRHGRLMATIGILSLVQVLAVIVAWLFVALLPEDLLAHFLGDSTQATLEVFPAAAVATLTLGLATVAMIGLKAIGNVRSSVRLKILTAPVTLAVMLVGTTLAGPAGSQIGLAIGEFTRTVFQWRLLRLWQKADLRESSHEL